ncbi:isoaspartyl peptidase/L-asparaginase [Halapricum hydrolyticum]|uniref:Plant-type L-asparaginase n=1 Tax=Halapricum hydrolyticum TaxID=2979991 RepID=A0AAE3LGV2_9EURY|nr:isoaspartyl peptidase/L-asparaginase [Halapricum hydrolyticum]MCU4717192.1 isoaspartyl peptidase/L-asparaginase [Halapricum hydrolyticum]MCU4726119.1 isoaspartyl peptidase/L-asparaginase [Halapricum hydrolyticum]
MDVIVHGGAGSQPDRPSERRSALKTAARRGSAAASPVDAVVAAVRWLESAPEFNAGVGSAVQSDGTIRTDAGIMTGRGSAGAACSMPGVEHAVEVARVVMASTPHVLLAGEHAVDLAASFGIETHVDLWTERTRERWNEVEPPMTGTGDQLAWVRDHFTGHDTVGAVATDGERVATATSTGGRWFALAGRVGDVPQIGAGFYASEAGGASATGAGEDIARETLARRAIHRLEEGADPQTAADRTIAEFDDTHDSVAGVIVMDTDGNAGRAHCGESMQTARDSF